MAKVSHQIIIRIKSVSQDPPICDIHSCHGYHRKKHHSFHPRERGRHIMAHVCKIDGHEMFRIDTSRQLADIISETTPLKTVVEIIDDVSFKPKSNRWQSRKSAEPSTPVKAVSLKDSAVGISRQVSRNSVCWGNLLLEPKTRKSAARSPTTRASHRVNPSGTSPLNTNTRTSSSVKGQGMICMADWHSLWYRAYFFWPPVELNPRNVWSDRKARKGFPNIPQIQDEILCQRMA